MNDHNAISIPSLSLIPILLACMVANGNARASSQQPTVVAEQSAKKTWLQIPLSTKKQHAAGVAGGEGFQMVISLTYAPSNPQVIYAGSDTAQIWRSRDGGASWQMKHDGFYPNGAIDILVDPMDENVAFACGGSLRLTARCGIYRTTDGGEHWSQVLQTAYHIKRKTGGKAIVAKFEGAKLVFDPKSRLGGRTRTIYAATQGDGLHRSKDSGTTWKKLGLGQQWLSAIQIDSRNPSTLYLASRQRGLLRVTVKRGRITKTVQIGKGLEGIVSSLVIHPTDPKVLFVAMGKGGLHKSTDRGQSFHKLSGPWPARQGFHKIAISPANPDYVFASAFACNKPNPFYSHDGGKTWTTPKTIDEGSLGFNGKTAWFSSPIAVHPTDPKIALSGVNGHSRIIKTTTGGKKWAFSGSGHTGARVGSDAGYCFTQDPDRFLFFLIDHGPYLTEDGGQTFSMLPSPRIRSKSSPCGACSPDGKTIVCAIGGWGSATKGQNLVASQDSGKTWKIFEEIDEKYHFIAVHPQDPKVFYAQHHRTEDGARSFQALKHPVFAVFEKDGDIVYSIDSIGPDWILLKSRDRGRTWQRLCKILPKERGNRIFSVKVSPQDEDWIFVGTSQGLSMFKDGKLTLLDEKAGLIKDGFGNGMLRSIAIDPQHPRVMYVGYFSAGVGHSNGVMRSLDHGATWKDITYNLGLPITVWGLAVNPHTGYVFLGSSQGNWKLPPPYQDR